MVTTAPAKYEVLKCFYGKYTWWPILQVVDFIPKGKNTPVQVATLSVTNNNELHATNHATAHLSKYLRYAIGLQRKADQRLREENSGTTSEWS